MAEIQIKSLHIHSLIEGVFHANIVYEKNGKDELLNCRPSDGVVLALRYDKPIFVHRTLMDEYGIIMEDDLNFEEDTPEKPGRPNEEIHVQHAKSFEDLLSRYTMEQLEKMLDDAESNEDYERAAKIRDEINRRG